MCEAPANQMTPCGITQAAVDAPCAFGINVEVRDRYWIYLNKFTVTERSYEPSYFLKFNYCDGDVRIRTFSSGGFHLKDMNEIANRIGKRIRKTRNASALMLTDAIVTGNGVSRLPILKHFYHKIKINFKFKFCLSK